MYRKKISLLFMLFFFMVVSYAQDNELQEQLSTVQVELQSLEESNVQLLNQLELYEEQVIDKQEILESLQIEIDTLKQTAE